MTHRRGVQITLDDIGPELTGWAKSNGLDPNRITMWSGCLPEVWGDQISYGLTVPDEDGKGDLWDEFHDRPLIVPKWAKVSPLPVGVGRVIEKCEQLPRHTCPTCGDGK